MKEYKATDPEMIQAQKDLAKMSNLSGRIITNDKDLFEELSTIQKIYLYRTKRKEKRRDFN